MRIGFVGGGVVGQALARSYLDHVDEVLVYDVLPERRTHSLDQVCRCDIIFVCLPSPHHEGGLTDSDNTQLDSFFAKLAGESIPLVLKTTVPPGSTKLYAEKYALPELIFSPEFLTQRCCVTDACMPACNVLGVPRLAGERIPESAETYERLISKRFPGARIHYRTSDEAELIKLLCNAFYATKVAFFNEARTLSDKLGAEWPDVLESVLAQGRIHPSHTRVPGPDGMFGFGGKCLGPDLSLFAHCLESAGLPAPVSRAASRRNGWDRERFVEEGDE